MCAVCLATDAEAKWGLACSDRILRSPSLILGFGGLEAQLFRLRPRERLRSQHETCPSLGGCSFSFVLLCFSSLEGAKPSWQPVQSCLLHRLPLWVCWLSALKVIRSLVSRLPRSNVGLDDWKAERRSGSSLLNSQRSREALPGGRLRWMYARAAMQQLHDLRRKLPCGHVPLPCLALLWIRAAQLCAEGAR